MFRVIARQDQNEHQVSVFPFSPESLLQQHELHCRPARIFRVAVSYCRILKLWKSRKIHTSLNKTHFTFTSQFHILFVLLSHLQLILILSPLLPFMWSLIPSFLLSIHYFCLFSSSDYYCYLTFRPLSPSLSLWAITFSSPSFPFSRVSSSSFPTSNLVVLFFYLHVLLIIPSFLYSFQLRPCSSSASSSRPSVHQA